MKHHMRIGELARRFGISASKIRYLETEGLLASAPRMSNGYRTYSEASAQSLEFILLAQSLGFTLDEIKAALNRSADGRLSCIAAVELLSAKALELEQKIAQAQLLRDRLLSATLAVESRAADNRALAQRNRRYDALGEFAEPVDPRQTNFGFNV